MIAIYKREVSSYFRSMTGYICIFAWLLLAGIFFFGLNLVSGYPSFSSALTGCEVFYLLVIPILTMRSMSEERRSRTDQLLLTAPTSVTGVVMGKYLAMLTVYAVPCVIFCLYPILIRLSGTATLASDYASILAFFLMGSVVIALGLLISSLTESQVLAAVGTYGVLLLMLLWSSIVSLLPTTAIASLVGCIVLLGLLCLLLHGMTQSWAFAGAVGLVGLAALIVLYVLRSSAFASLLPNVLGAFNLVAPFVSVAGYSLLDVGGLLFYVSLDALLVFLTIQIVLRRRYC